MGPLQSIRIVEMAGIGPAPFCGMMLADMGAEVIRVQQPGPAMPAAPDPLLRSRKSLVCDLKHPDGAEVVLRLLERADGLFEGFRPGVMERAGLGPEPCLQRNPALVYGRMTGWGQGGPLAQAAGHDINYIALTGALHEIGPTGGKPVPPLNLVGDFGGGGMMLAYGMVCALLEARSSGQGQVVDAAMTDGTHTLMALFHGLRAMGLHSEGTGASFLGGAAHYYNTYETSDGKYVAIGPLEPQFYALLIEKLELDAERFGPQGFQFAPIGEEQQAAWPTLREELAAVFRERTRDEWCELLEGSDVCFAPVLSLSEAPEHPHNRARGAFVDVGGQLQPAPAPRLSRSGAARPRPGTRPGAHTDEILRDAGFDDGEIDRLLRDGVVSRN